MPSLTPSTTPYTPSRDRELGTHGRSKCTWPSGPRSGVGVRHGDDCHGFVTAAPGAAVTRRLYGVGSTVGSVGSVVGSAVGSGAGAVALTVTPGDGSDARSPQFAT